MLISSILMRVRERERPRQEQGMIELLSENSQK